MLDRKQKVCLMEGLHYLLEEKALTAFLLYLNREEKPDQKTTPSL